MALRGTIVLFGALTGKHSRRPAREVYDRPRYLARQNGHFHPEQYTASSVVALPHEPEPVDEETQREFSDEARRR